MRGVNPRRAPRLLAHLLLAVLCLPSALLVHGIVLSTSSLQSCVRDGSGAELDVKCEKKVVVTLAVGNGASLATEQLDFSLMCIGSPDGSCPCPCNYQTDPTCNCRDLAAPLSLTVTKTPVWASYPMQYITSFNYKPYEAVVRPASAKCTDSDWEVAPTCGWYYVGSYKVPDSQGFACECSASQIWDSTLGNGNTERTRANINCDFFKDAIDIIVGKPPCSAHCLMFDPLWYSGYELGPPSLQFDITVTVDVPVAVSSSNTPSPAAAYTTNATMPNGTAGPPPSPSSPPPAGAPPPPAVVYRREMLGLSPSVTLAATTSRLVSTNLLGDLSTYTSLPELSTRLLMIPQPNTWTVEQILASNRSSWMLLPASSVDRDDTLCNKVGTVFSAFKHQPNACFRAPQSCLDNQIKDLQAKDSERVAAGKVPLYSVGQLTYGAASMMASFKGGPLSFAVPVPSQSNSLVVINVAADSVQLVTNASPGNISGAQICTYGESRCGGFEAGASRGYLKVNVTNTGYVAASFTLTLTKCSVNIRPVEARALSLAPGVLTPVEPYIQVYVEDPFYDEGRYCWLTLYDSQARVVATHLVTFYTNATVLDNKPVGGLNSSGDGAGPQPDNSTSCSVKCGQFWDLLCYARSKCWGKMGVLLGTTIGVAALIGTLVMLAKLGLLALCMSSATGFLGRCCGGTSKPDDKPELFKQPVGVNNAEPTVLTEQELRRAVK
ncbi:hypothetical protein FOA52_014767 [Chlamydomonas sp. UWO 241]|nr:hypothetical protein FOA52_014767 [Chlamydomonas sp. UWO 241]